MKKTIIIGAGARLNYAKNILDNENFKNFEFLDYKDFNLNSKELQNYKNYFLALKDYNQYSKLLKLFKSLKLNNINIISDKSYISKRARLGSNIFINPFVSISINCFFLISLVLFLNTHLYFGRINQLKL